MTINILYIVLNIYNGKTFVEEMSSC